MQGLLRVYYHLLFYWWCKLVEWRFYTLNVFFQAVLWGEILIDSLGPLRLQWLVRQALLVDVGWSSPVLQWLYVRHHTVLRPVLPRAVPRVQSFFMMQTLS